MRCLAVHICFDLIIAAVLPLMAVGVLAAGVNDEDLLLSWLSPQALSPSINGWKANPGGRKDAKHAGAKTNYYPSVAPPHNGLQRLLLGERLVEMEDCNLNLSFITGGKRAYQIGSMRGGFLRRGIVWGDEAGVWSQPYKMLDGVLIELVEDGGSWILDDSRRFTNHVSHVVYNHTRDGIEVERADFVPVEHPAVFYRVVVRNKSERPRTLSLRFTFQENIRPIWHKPWRVEYGQDSIEQAGEGWFLARDRLLEGVELAFGSLGKPDRQSIDTRNSYRNRGVLEFDFVVQPQRAYRQDFLAVMHDRRKAAFIPEDSFSSAAEGFAVLRGKRPMLLEQKVEDCHEALFRSSVFRCPDRDLEAAYLGAKMGLLLLSADTRPYLHAPHLMTCPERGYQLLFGIDTLYASIGAVLGGQQEVAISTLENHLHYAGQIEDRGINFLVDHWGIPGGEGRAQETTQLIGTFWEMAKSTGRRDLCAAHYPQLKRLLASRLPRDDSANPWPEGMTFPGLTKLSGADAMLSAAVRLCWAVEAMQRLAEVVQQPADAVRYAEIGRRLRSRFNHEWWSEERSIWAVGLKRSAEGMTPVHLADYRARSLHYPQKYGLADHDKGVGALRTQLQDAVDREGGFHAPAVTPWQNSLLAISCFRYGLREEGRRLLWHAASNSTRQEKMLGVFSTMNPSLGSEPSNQNKFLYAWSCGPFIEAVLVGLLGLEADAFNRTVHFNPAVPDEWNAAELRAYPVGEASLDFELHGDRWVVRRRGGDASLTIHYGRGGSLVSRSLDAGETISFPRISDSWSVDDAGARGTLRAVKETASSTPLEPSIKQPLDPLPSAPNLPQTTRSTPGKRQLTSAASTPQHSAESTLTRHAAVRRTSPGHP